jgi:DNA-binding MurR/RpiR family transcriptional regulator
LTVRELIGAARARAVDDAAIEALVERLNEAEAIYKDRARRSTVTSEYLARTYNLGSLE